MRRKKKSGEKQTWGGKSPRYRVKDEVCATSRERIDRERREGKRGEERRWGRGKREKRPPSEDFVRRKVTFARIINI